jgi:hypothetical protein
VRNGTGAQALVTGGMVAATIQIAARFVVLRDYPGVLKEPARRGLAMLRPGAASRRFQIDS